MEEVGAAPGARSPPPLTSIIPLKIPAHLPGGKSPLAPPLQAGKIVVAGAAVAAKNSMPPRLVCPEAVTLPQAEAVERIRHTVDLRGGSGRLCPHRRRRLMILGAVVVSTGKLIIIIFVFSWCVTRNLPKYYFIKVLWTYFLFIIANNLPFSDSSILTFFKNT